MSTALRRCIDNHGNEEGFVLIHVVSAINRELPLTTEVTLVSCFGVGGDNADEQSAVVDLLPDAAVPGVSATSFLAIEPDLHASGAQSFRNALSGRRILRCVAQKYGT